MYSASKETFQVSIFHFRQKLLHFKIFQPPLITNVHFRQDANVASQKKRCMALSQSLSFNTALKVTRLGSEVFLKWLFCVSMHRRRTYMRVQLLLKTCYSQLSIWKTCDWTQESIVNLWVSAKQTVCYRCTVWQGKKPTFPCCEIRVAAENLLHLMQKNSCPLPLVCTADKRVVSDHLRVEVSSTPSNRPIGCNNPAKGYWRVTWNKLSMAMAIPVISSAHGFHKILHEITLPRKTNAMKLKNKPIELVEGKKTQGASEKMRIRNDTFVRGLFQYCQDSSSMFCILFWQGKTTDMKTSMSKVRS